jgi:RNA polymerase sigma-70 factor (ECF subfamily)
VNHDDRRLIAEVLAGQTSAYAELVRRYQGRLFSVVLRVLDNAEDAADVVQDTFVSAYQSLGSFKGDAEFFTWLYRIAFNTAISAKRKRKPTTSLEGRREQDGGSGQNGIDPADRGRDNFPGANLERTDDEKMLADAIRRLSEEHRAVLVLKDLEGFRYDEIAAVIGVPVGTVRSRLNRARLELRSILNPTATGPLDFGSTEGELRTVKRN